MSEVIRTLVVDDEQRIRFFLVETLERVGHIVTAVALFRQVLQNAVHFATGSIQRRGDDCNAAIASECRGATGAGHPHEGGRVS